jgi:pimeloyl-ACP methyl ester carboxylesterase
MEAQTDLVGRLLRHLDIGPSVVIGHSMGGSIATLLAEREKDLVSHVMSAEGNLDPGPGFVSGRITSIPEDAFVAAGHGKFVEQVRHAGFPEYAGTVQCADPCGLYRSAASLIADRTPTYREIFYGLTIPRTYIFGEKTLPDPDAETLAEQGVDVRVVPSAGHAMMLDNPDGFALAVASAIDAAR